ncbi:MAG: hypothetical protein R3C56_42645 [Pirellulaceae bacterium]
MNHAADAAASLATVVPVAYETPVGEIASGDANYDTSVSAEDDYYLSDAQIVPAAQLETVQGCPTGVHAAGCSCCAPTAHNNFREPYRMQEYIFDGGDQQPAVVIKEDWSTAGVDPTDTVVYYETLAGSVCAAHEPSTHPRRASEPFDKYLVCSWRCELKGRNAYWHPLVLERFDENNLAGTVVQPLAPHGEQQVGLIDAFQENYVTPPMEQIQPLYRMSAARVPFELVDPTRTGLITIQELVDMQQFIHNAQTWVIPESLEVEISNQAALLVKDTKAAQDFVVYELPDKCDEDLQGGQPYNR